MPASKDAIRIRMYRVGFGDCFLVTFPTADGPKHVLVDCGVHNRGDIGTMDRVLADIETETGGRVAIVIASHAHEDHISGFKVGEAMFKRFQIAEVWLPWSENRGDPVARGLRARLAALETALSARFALMGADAPPDVLDILANTSAKRNDPILDNLRRGLGAGATPDFMEAGKMKTDAGGIAGLTARILGPTRDESFLKKMDPPKAERFPLALADETDDPTAIEPFDAWIELDAVTGAETSHGVPPTKVQGPRLTNDQRRELTKTVELSPDALAFALDRATNNLSVVALFTYRGESLLFAGDSQYGGWKSWMEQPDAADVLGDVTFYKVAHHGSENATPKSALDRMGDGTMTAMMSTQELPWPSIPDRPLLEALGGRTARRLLRSDSLALPDAPLGPVVDPLPDGFTAGPFWVDHHIPL
jgi:beta-lactamase superfamily II metal-dependent hydrolase